MRISDWSSDVCSSDLRIARTGAFAAHDLARFHEQVNDIAGGGIDEIGGRALCADAERIAERSLAVGAVKRREIACEAGRGVERQIAFVDDQRTRGGQRSE